MSAQRFEQNGRQSATVGFLQTGQRDMGLEKLRERPSFAFPLYLEKSERRPADEAGLYGISTECLAESLLELAALWLRHGGEIDQDLAAKAAQSKLTWQIAGDGEVHLQAGGGREVRTGVDIDSDKRTGRFEARPALADDGLDRGERFERLPDPRGGESVILGVQCADRSLVGEKPGGVRHPPAGETGRGEKNVRRRTKPVAQRRRQRVFGGAGEEGGDFTGERGLCGPFRRSAHDRPEIVGLACNGAGGSGGKPFALGGVADLLRNVDARRARGQDHAGALGEPPEGESDRLARFGKALHLSGDLLALLDRAGIAKKALATPLQFTECARFRQLAGHPCSDGLAGRKAVCTLPRGQDEIFEPAIDEKRRGERPVSGGGDGDHPALHRSTLMPAVVRSVAVSESGRPMTPE